MQLVQKIMPVGGALNICLVAGPQVDCQLSLLVKQVGIKGACYILFYMVAFHFVQFAL